MFAITWRRFQVSSDLVFPPSLRIQLLKWTTPFNPTKAAHFEQRLMVDATMDSPASHQNSYVKWNAFKPPYGGTPVKSKFTFFLLAAGLVLASSNGFAAGSDVSANLRLMAFGNAPSLNRSPTPSRASTRNIQT